MKLKGLFILLLCLVILTGCNKTKFEDKDPQVSTNTPPASETFKDPKEKDLQQLVLDLSTEDAIKEYLVGEWVFEKEYISDKICKMSIDGDLNIHLSFYHAFTDELKGDYTGKIILDRQYAKPNEAPDLISIDLSHEDWPGGDYLFLHRTIYDGKRVMSLFFAGNGNGIFDMLTWNDDYDYRIEEVMLEKTTGEISLRSPLKNKEFYAVFWGHGVHYESIWLDEVQWTPPEEEDDYSTLYPRAMTLYEDNNPGSVLYTIDPEKSFDILGDDMFKGEVYYVETDENGNIVQLINAEYKRYLEECSDNYIDLEIEDLIYDIITNDIVEIQEYLDDGMSILLTGETTIIDGEECYDVVLGTDHEETFVREIHYAVNIFTRQVYKYDILNDTWETMGAG